MICPCPCRIQNILTYFNFSPFVVFDGEDFKPIIAQLSPGKENGAKIRLKGYVPKLTVYLFPA